MIDRIKLNSILDKLDELDSIPMELSLRIKDGKFQIELYPLNWWRGTILHDDERHKVLSSLTPLVGKLEKSISDGNISWSGSLDNIEIAINRADKCKILGYKKITRTVKKEIEREPVEPEYEEVEEEVNVPITDCDIRSGKASEEEIEVPA